MPFRNVYFRQVELEQINEREDGFIRSAVLSALGQKEAREAGSVITEESVLTAVQSMGDDKARKKIEELRGLRPDITTANNIERKPLWKEKTVKQMKKK